MARLHATLTVLTAAEGERYGYATAGSILTAAEFHDFEREENSEPSTLPSRGRRATCRWRGGCSRVQPARCSPR